MDKDRDHKTVHQQTPSLFHNSIEGVTSATDENAVIALLADFALKLGYKRSRVYDSNTCPFDGTPFFTLRSTSSPLPRATLGYSIYEASLSKEAADKGRPVWENSESETIAKSPAKRRWMEDLGLQGCAWVDAPIFSADKLVALWTFDRPLQTPPTEGELADADRFAKICGLKIHELRQTRLRELTTRIFSEVGTNQDRSTLLSACCAEIARTIDATFVAYFEYDHVHGMLRKMVEFSATDQKLIDVDPGADTTYEVGSSLTGTAWGDDNLQYIPDFQKLVERRPDLVDEASKRAHEVVMGRDIRSVIYRKVSSPGSSQGFLRAINRSDQPFLRFSGAHFDILASISAALAQIFSAQESSMRLDAIWDAFDGSLTKLKMKGIEYDSMATAAGRLGYPTMIVLTWYENRVLSEAWSNHSNLKKELRDLIGTLICPTELSPPTTEIVPVDKLGAVLREILRLNGIERLYLVPAPQRQQQRAAPERFVTLFPYLIRSPTTKRRRFAHDLETHTPSLKILDVLGRMAASAYELARNRDLLYLAELATGTIAHEINTPTSSLISLARVVCQHQRQIFAQLPADAAISTDAVEVSETGRLISVTYTGPTANIAWLDEKSRLIESSGKLVRKVVNDALRWARLEGRLVELDLQPINLLRVIRDCLYELRTDIRGKPPLYFEISPNVSLVPDFAADELLLHHLFINLLDNAIKYSHVRGKGHETKVRIYAERQSNLVNVRISNWGMGIAESDYEAIFSTLFRSSVRDRVHTVRGVGLGLSTCRRIAELHSGEITVRSEQKLDDPDRIQHMEGFQTTFTVRLPLNLKEGRRDVDTTLLRRRG